MIIFDYSFPNTGGGGVYGLKHAVHSIPNFLKKFFRQYSEVFYRACVSHIPFSTLLWSDYKLIILNYFAVYQQFITFAKKGYETSNFFRH